MHVDRSRDLLKKISFLQDRLSINDSVDWYFIHVDWPFNHVALLRKALLQPSKILSCKAGTDVVATREQQNSSNGKPKTKLFPRVKSAS